MTKREFKGGGGWVLQNASVSARPRTIFCKCGATLEKTTGLCWNRDDKSTTHSPVDENGNQIDDRVIFSTDAPIKLHDCSKEYSGDCGACVSMADNPNLPPRLYADHDSTNFAKIVEWLYTNHEGYGSAKDWRKNFVIFLKKTLLN